ncbi:unnamed protein product [Rotaria sp. Silwood2]|nr:unnamed protein product [Rotaria sp. Silwood2]CAF2866338.1 unnamed protein product [Rotaria sp. Silwood2]CAF3173144.1 unnamed protein product [Rotaria sp. Silwood2]CAF3402764.1 unnamed protein product [Rotaria sp. Silwood2]CAF4057388.1 unnamed protein product [Rotaria sp. Silwood2]
MHGQSYYQGPIAMPTTQRQGRRVSDGVSGAIPGVFGATQLILCVIIVALEVVSIYYDPGRGTIYAGLWSSAVFSVTWISMFCYLCCGKSSGCGVYLVIQNIINLIFTILLLIFTSRFVKNPCLCYSALCYLPNWGDISRDDDDDDDYFSYSCTSRTLRKLPVLKGLLACAVLMLVSNILFIVIYSIVSIRLRRKARCNTQQPNVAYHQQSAAVQLGSPPPYYPSTTAYPSNQHQYLYPVQDAQLPSAPPPYETNSHKF